MKEIINGEFCLTAMAFVIDIKKHEIWQISNDSDYKCALGVSLMLHPLSVNECTNAEKSCVETYVWVTYYKYVKTKAINIFNGHLKLTGWTSVSLITITCASVYTCLVLKKGYANHDFCVRNNKQKRRTWWNIVLFHCSHNVQRILDKPITIGKTLG